MALKKSIPRVATAALTLGGAAAGCGGDGGDDVIVVTGEEDWCNAIGICYGWTNNQYLDCVYDYQDYVLSYYSAYCQSVIRDMWFCFTDYVSCGELAGANYSDCSPEIYDAYYLCYYEFYYYY